MSSKYSKFLTALFCAFIGGVLLTFVAERLGIAACAVGLGLMFIDSLIQCINRTE